MRRFLMALVAAIVCASTAQAVTVTESTDFKGVGARPTMIGTLDVGVNSVSGSIDGICYAMGHSTCNFFLADDGDLFTFDIAAGTQLTAASLTISGLSTTGSATPSIVVNTIGDLTSLGNSPNGTFDLLAGAPVTGTQVIKLFPELSKGYRFFDIFKANWSVALTVEAIPSAVPLPAGLPLLLAGIGGLAALRRRKTR